jgi:hypothetical protein
MLPTAAGRGRAVSVRAGYYLSSILILLCDGNSEREHSSMLRHPFDFDPASDGVRAFPHAHQAKGCRGSKLVFGNSSPIVPDLYHDLTRFDCDRDVDSGRMSMPANIRQRFLKNSEDGRRRLTLKMDFLPRGKKLTADHRVNFQLPFTATATALPLLLPGSPRPGRRAASLLPGPCRAGRDWPAG